MFTTGPVTETTIFAHGKRLQTSLNTSRRLDKLPETRRWTFQTFHGASASHYSHEA